MSRLDPATRTNLAAQLRRQESKGGKPSLVAYPCPAGFATIGHGHNLEARLPKVTPEEAAIRRVALLKMRITPEDAERLLASDMEAAEVALLDHWPWMVGLDGVRLAAFVNLAFNMGVPRLAGFKDTLAALQAGDYETAANELQDSRWFRQVGDGGGGYFDRGEEIVSQVRAGAWSPKFFA